MIRNFPTASVIDLLSIISGKAAINFPRNHSTSGGWHYFAYWDSAVGQAKVSLAGIHYPDTTFYFGDKGILNATDELERRGWKIDRQIYMADHFRATRDMVLNGYSAVQSFATSSCPSGFRTIRIWLPWSNYSVKPLTSWKAYNEIASIGGLNRSSCKMVGALSACVGTKYHPFIPRPIARQVAMINPQMQQILPQVIKVVERAGVLLAEECVRPGGRRGYGDKAEIDVEIEVFLREELLRILRCDWWGEETGHVLSDNSFCWVVDPNDGTSDFLKGLDGSAISVGLLHNNHPVLGVVHAPVTPGGSPDCISWAQGIRHAESAANAGLATTSPSSIALTALGHHQAWP